MINDVLSKFEDKVRLLVAHVSLLKKENLSLRNQIIERSADGAIGNKPAIRSKLLPETGQGAATRSHITFGC